MKKPSQSKKTLVFSIAEYDLDEAARVIDLAREAGKTFDVLIMSYGCVHDHLIEGEGFRIFRIEPGQEKETSH